MRRLLILITLVVGGCKTMTPETTIGVATEVTGASQEATPEKIAAVKSMFQIKGIDKQMTGGFEAMLPIVDQQATQLQLTPEEMEEMRNICRDWFENDLDHQLIMNQLTLLYAETFTIEEIQASSEFYKSAAGQIFLTKSPELMKAAAQIGAKEAQRKQEKLVERLQLFLEQHQK